MRKVLAVLLSSFLVIGIEACGGGSAPAPPPPPPPSSGLTVKPASANVGLGQTFSFSVSATGASTPPVTWSVNGVTSGNSTVGTIDASGKYTAPGSFPNPATVTIGAVATNNTSLSGTASVTVAIPNDTANSQTPPIKLGTTGGSSTDSTTNGTTITCCSGTLGSLWTRGTGTFILSNNHVLDKSDRGAAGDNVTQPGLVDDNCGQSPSQVVAHLTESAALKPATGTNGPSPSNVDAAIAQIVTVPVALVDTSGNILDLAPTAGSTSIAPAPPSSTLAIPTAVLTAGEHVAKVGRSTGLTCSTLQSVSTSVSVDYEASCGSNTTAFTSTFTNQVIVNGGAFSASGDSGSLIVTADTARPVALLYGGNDTSTSAHPIQDVISAFSSPTKGTLTIVGGLDHAVSCATTGEAPGAARGGNPNAATLSASEQQRAARARAAAMPALLQDKLINSVGVGPSADNPYEGAIMIHVSSSSAPQVPQQINGVRTRVVFDGPAQIVGLDPGQFESARAVKDAHVDSLMHSNGIQGVGVGRSDDNPDEPAIVIYVIRGQAHPAIPPVMDGVRTKVVEGDRFRSFNWGHETVPSQKSCVKKTK